MLEDPPNVKEEILKNSNMNKKSKSGIMKFELYQMRGFKSVLVFVFAIVFMFNTFGQNHKAFKEVELLMKEQETAWNKGDILSYMQHYWQSDSMMFVSKKGVTYGWKQTLDNYLKAYPDKETMGSLKFDKLIFQYIGKNQLMVIGSWNLIRDKGNVGGYFSLLWRKINGKWKIVIDHTS